jgi:hypothetical protein
MVRPAKTTDGRIHCENCLESSVGGDVDHERVRDDGDVRAYNLECPDCGATGSMVVELGFGGGTEIESPFTEDF